MFGMGHWPWIIGLVIVLIIFGPGKLPQIGGAVGQALREFRRATSELKDEVARHTDAVQAAPAPTPPTVTTTTPVAPAENKTPVIPAEKDKIEPTNA